MSASSGEGAYGLGANEMNYGGNATFGSSPYTTGGSVASEFFKWRQNRDWVSAVRGAIEVIIMVCAIVVFFTVFLGDGGDTAQTVSSSATLVLLVGLLSLLLSDVFTGLAVSEDSKVFRSKLAAGGSLLAVVGSIVMAIVMRANA